MPYSAGGTGNWENFTAALAEVGYRGVMSLECMGDIPDVKRELRLYYERLTYGTGRYLADCTEKINR